MRALKSKSFIILKMASFISSMIPLSFYLLLKYFSNNKKLIDIKFLTPKNIVIIIFLVEILSVMYVLYFFLIKIRINRFNNYKKVRLLNEPTQEKTNTSNYLLANVLPIVVFDFEKKENFIFVCLLLFLLAFMYIKNGLYYINPLYDIINIKVYENCEFLDVNHNKHLKNKMVISKVNLYNFPNVEYRIIENEDLIILSEKIK